MDITKCYKCPQLVFDAGGDWCWKTSRNIAQLDRCPFEYKPPPKNKGQFKRGARKNQEEQ